MLVGLLSRNQRIKFIGKIPASGSATIFLSKEIENINRAMSIRRVAFACYCCDPELVRQHFPMLLEKIVDILKLPVGIAVAEVLSNV